MRLSFTAASLTLLTVTAGAISIAPASAGGWGHGPSLHQAGRFVHDSVHQVIVPVIAGAINTLGAGAAHSAHRNGGGEYMEGDDPQVPVPAPQAHDEPKPQETDTSTDPGAHDPQIMPWKEDSLLDSLKNLKEMPLQPAGPTIGRVHEPIPPPSCGMNCPAIIDSPANDLPDPREEKSAEPPPRLPEILD